MNPPVYDPRTRKWHFSRQPSSNLAYRLFPATDPKRTVKAALKLDSPSTSAVRRRRTWTQFLAQDAPEFGVAMPWIEDYFEESHLVATSSSITDPLVGRLLDFGTVLDTNSHTANVVGYATGVTGSDLALSEMTTRRREFADSRGVDLETPQIQYPKLPPAHIFNSPIRQICFASNPYPGEHSNPRLAVRTSASTKIFRQKRLRTPLAGQVTRILLQPLATVDGSSSNDSADHADVSFNPFYDRQFSIIDQKGNWKLWDIEGAYSAFREGSGISLRESTKGQITPPDEANSDGWGRITWGADSNSIFACDRRRAGLFDIRASPTVAVNIKYPQDRQRSWILDLRRGPVDGKGNDAFLLTSSDIVWVDVRQPGRSLLSWPHHRHRDDVSLSMELFHHNTVTTAIVGSRMNSLTTCYEFAFLGDLSPIPTIVGDPYLVSPPYGSSDPSLGAISMAILPCSVRARGGFDIPKSGQDVSYFFGLSISKELKITERIYSTRDEKLQLIEKGDIDSRKRLVKSTEFVIGDSDIEMKDAPHRSNSKSRSRSRSKSKKDHLRGKDQCKLTNILGQPESHRSMNLQELYNLAFTEGEEVLRTAQPGDEENNIAGFCDRLSEILARRVERGDLGVASLLEVHSPSLLFDKLSDLQINAQGLLESPGIQDHYDIHSLLPRSTTGLGLEQSAEERISIESIYQYLLETRVNPLPPAIPGRVRLRRERLCRLIATQLFLASRGLSLKPSAEVLEPSPAIFVPTPSQPTPPFRKEPLERIRAYAHVQSRIELDSGIQAVLDNWKIGDDPHEFEFFVDPEEGVPRYKKDRKKERRERKAANSTQGSSVLNSQPPALGKGGPSTQATQIKSIQAAGSTQQGFSAMSQVERGKHGGRKQQKKRKTGF